MVDEIRLNSMLESVRDLGTLSQFEDECLNEELGTNESFPLIYQKLMFAKDKLNLRQIGLLLSALSYVDEEGLQSSERSELMEIFNLYRAHEDESIRVLAYELVSLLPASCLFFDEWIDSEVSERVKTAIRDEKELLEE